MKFYFLLCSMFLLASSVLLGQVVHADGTPVVSLNWQSDGRFGVSGTDSLVVDLDGDGSPDLTFIDSHDYSAGQGQPTSLKFSVIVRLTVQVALDSAEYDSAHRYQVGEPIMRAVRWSDDRSTAYIAYTIQGNGGTGGRGFFRDGQQGYVVVRKRSSGVWRYWWFNVKGRRYNDNMSYVNFYGSSAPVLTAASPAVARPAAFPNPTTAGWHIAGLGPYRLLDAIGRVQASGTLTSTTFINAEKLAAGLYLLLVGPLPDGTKTQQRLVRQ